MMICPKDQSELVFLGARGSSRGAREATYLFCAHCSTAILVLGRIGSRASGGSFDGTMVFWHYSPEGMEPLKEVPDEAAPHRGVLKGHVESFLKRRDTFGSYCSRDGMKARLILDLGDMKFVWCGGCKFGFAFYRHLLYGWPQVGSFHFDPSTKSYSPREPRAPVALNERFLTGLAQLPEPR